MLGLSPIYRPQPMREIKQKDIKDIHEKYETPHTRMMSMLPSPSIMKAMGTLIPRAFALNKPHILDASLVPKDSSIRHLFETEESNKSSTAKTTVRVQISREY
jgi:hypothetical protein